MGRSLRYGVLMDSRTISPQTFLKKYRSVSQSERSGARFRIDPARRRRKIDDHPDHYRDDPDHRECL